MSTTQSRAMALHTTVDEAVIISAALRSVPAEAGIAPLNETMRQCVAGILAVTPPYSKTRINDKAILVWLGTDRGSWG